MPLWFNNFSKAASDGQVYENGREIINKGRKYIFTDELTAAIDVALGLGRPLLVSGEPGCGKTELGYAIARRMNIHNVHFFSTKSNSEARDLFYTYDAIGRFREAQIRSDAGSALSDAADYIEFQALGRAILDAHPIGEVKHLLRGRRTYSHPGKAKRSVVIIDEIDKASRDFPNDLLKEIEDLTFRVPEMARDPNAPKGARKAAGPAITAGKADGKQDGGEAPAPESVRDPETPGGIPRELRPIVVVTSNEERQLPDAFLRRCVFHEIAFPGPATLALIMESGLGKRFPEGGFKLPDSEREILLKLLADFRNRALDKAPGISEMIDAATLLAYRTTDEPTPGLTERLGATVTALAKLKTDREKLKGIVGHYTHKDQA